MSITRSTHEERKYRQYRRNNNKDDCPFCSIDSSHPQYIDQTKNFKIINNHIPYSLWDGQGVIEHLMVIPRIHIDTLADIPLIAKREYLTLISSYETRGYDVYARAKNSGVRSVAHQHTHLLRLDGKNKRIMFVLKRPFYLRLSW